MVTQAVAENIKSHAESRRAVFSSSKKKYCANKRFSVTLNLRYMHGVLNVNEIKN
jgi:hypothetical protein